MDQELSLDVARELALHRLNAAEENVEELLAGGANLDDLAESGVLGEWKSSEEKAQAKQERETEQATLLEALKEAPVGIGGLSAEEF